MLSYFYKLEFTVMTRKKYTSKFKTKVVLSAIFVVATGFFFLKEFGS